MHYEAQSGLGKIFPVNTGNNQRAVMTLDVKPINAKMENETAPAPIRETDVTYLSATGITWLSLTVAPFCFPPWR